MTRASKNEGRVNVPMPSEEQKVSLIVQCDNLPSLKLGHWRKSCLEHAANSVPKTSYKVVQNELWIVRCSARMSLMARMSRAQKKRRRDTNTDKYLLC